MNRGLLLGVALFLAVVGIAMLGGDNQAVAGHGCGGCGGAAVACDGMYACGGYVPDCGGMVACYGARPRHRLFHHRRQAVGGCMGVAVMDCCGAGYPVAKGGYIGPVQKGAVQKEGGAFQKGGALQKEGGAFQKGGAEQKGAMQKDGTARQINSAAMPFVYYQMSYRR